MIHGVVGPLFTAAGDDKPAEDGVNPQERNIGECVSWRRAAISTRGATWRYDMMILETQIQPMPQVIVQPRPLLLASISPRRRELLTEKGYEFEVAEPPFDEPELPGAHVPPANYAESLAFFKARSVAKAHPQHVILAADTIAVLDGEIIGKAGDRDDAYRILRAMSGTTHDVITGVALYAPQTGRRRIAHDVTTIRVHSLTDKQIADYLNTGEWIGKAGAYGIQDEGDKFVERVQGSFTNVVGLPMELIERLFVEWEG